jgi:MoxR-like ATPase
MPIYKTELNAPVTSGGDSTDESQDTGSHTRGEATAQQLTQSDHVQIAVADLQDVMRDPRGWDELQGWELKKTGEACKTVIAAASGEVRADERAMAHSLQYSIRQEWNRRNELAKKDPAAARREAEVRDEISERTGKPKKAPRGKPFGKGRDARRNSGGGPQGDAQGDSGAGQEGAQGENGDQDAGSQADSSESESDDQNPANEPPSMQSMKEQMQLPQESTEERDGTLESAMRRIAREEDYKVVTAVDANFQAISKELARIAKIAKRTGGNGVSGNTTIILDKQAGITVQIDGELHEAFERVMKAIHAGFRNIWLAGPAGCGKSVLAKQISDALAKTGFTNGDYWEQSMSVGATEALFFGRLLPFGEAGQFEYMETDWVRIYEHGGVTLLDEIDGSDANMLLSLNGPIEQGRMSLPARRGNTMAKRADNHILLAAANTWGHGAQREYAGRNALDSAFLTRFEGAEFDMDYDRDLEKRLCADRELLAEIWRIRDVMRTTGIRRKWGSTRTVVRANLWRKSGMSVRAAVRTMLGGSWTPDDLAKIGYAGAKPAGSL